MAQPRAGDRGLTLLEILFVLAIAGTVATMAVPLTETALDEIRTASAARYVSARIMAIRMDAIRRSTAVALRFERAGDDYTFTSVVDGNGNGVRTADITAGIDMRVGIPEQLAHAFRDVRFGLLDGAPDADGQPAGGTDGVRIGTARILTMSPDGTATAGTLYIRGRRSQYAVRVLGVTGRTRVLQYQQRDRTWNSR
jgi:prepilin-type N-terminal cleavage/methylation domain-containing protein